MTHWNRLADKSLEGIALSRREGRAVLGAGPEQTPALVAATYQVRRRHFGRRVRLNYLLNTKSGLCSEDCHYCSQSKRSSAPIQKYPWMPVADVLHMADRAVALHAGRFCMVASGRGPTPSELARMVECVKAVRERHPQLEICCCLGLLSAAQAKELKAAGVEAVNHNLNTSERFYGEICGTHAYADRLSTVRAVKQAGASACSGALIGMGETADDILDLAYALRELEVESLPVNFLMPIPGTAITSPSPLRSCEKNSFVAPAGRRPGASLDGKRLGPGLRIAGPTNFSHLLTPTYCLNVLCLFRFLNPKASLRIAGGREIHLRSLQALGLYVANSIFIGDYLTTKGQPAEADLAMIRDLGFEIEGDPPAKTAGGRSPEGWRPLSAAPPAAVPQVTLK